MTHSDFPDAQAGLFPIVMRLNRDQGALESRVGSLERRLEERLEAQSKELDELKREAKDTNEKLDQVLSIVQAGKTSWKTITIAGSVVATIFAALIWLAQNVAPLVTVRAPAPTATEETKK